MFSLTWRAGGTCQKVNMMVITAWLKSWSSGTYTLHPCTKGQGFGQNYHLVLRIPKGSSDCIFSFFAWQFSFNNFMIFYILSSPVIVLDLRLCLVLAQKPKVDMIALDFQRLWDETWPWSSSTCSLHSCLWIGFIPVPLSLSKAITRKAEETSRFLGINC